MEDNIIGIEDVNTSIYRIFSIKRFKELIKTKKLVLVNPYKWDDPFENFFLRANAIDQDGSLVSLQNIANSWYGQCWTFNKESDALWRIYSSDKDGVRVKTTVKKLFSSVWNDNDKFKSLNYFIGAVEYKSRKEIEEFMNNTSFWDIAIGGQNDGFAKLLCIKRLEFQHENEVRLLIHDNNNIGKNGRFGIDIECENIFEEICLDPRLEEDSYEELKEEIKKYIKSVPIIQSELYKVTLNPIKLQ